MTGEVSDKQRIQVLEQEVQELRTQIETTVPKADLEFVQVEINTLQTRNQEISDRIKALEDWPGVDEEKLRNELENQKRELVGVIQEFAQNNNTYIQASAERERQLTEVWVKSYTGSEIDRHLNAAQNSYQPSSEHLNDLRTMIELLHNLCKSTMVQRQSPSCSCQIQETTPVFTRTSEQKAHPKQEGKPEPKPLWLDKQEQQEQQAHMDIIIELLEQLKKASKLNIAYDELWNSLSAEAQILLRQAMTEDPELNILKCDLSLTTEGRQWLAGLYSYVKLLSDLSKENENDQPF